MTILVKKYFFNYPLLYVGPALLVILKLEEDIPLDPAPGHADELLTPVTHDGGAAVEGDGQEVDLVTAQGKRLP